MVLWVVVFMGVPPFPVVCDVVVDWRRTSGVRGVGPLLSCQGVNCLSPPLSCQPLWQTWCVTCGNGPGQRDARCGRARGLDTITGHRWTIRTREKWATVAFLHWTDQLVLLTRVVNRV